MRHDGAIGICRWLPAGARPTAEMPSLSKGGSKRKGTVNLRRVPSARLHEQNGLNRTGHGPFTVSRATAGSMVRQRSTRRKPLYLQLQAPKRRMGFGGASRSELVRLDVPTGGCAIAHSGRAPSYSPFPCIARGRACHLKTRRSSVGTWELVARPPVTDTGYPRRPGKVGREGGAPVVVGARESRAHGEGGQGVGRHPESEQRSVDSDQQASALAAQRTTEAVPVE